MAEFTFDRDDADRFGSVYRSTNDRTPATFGADIKVGRSTAAGDNDLDSVLNEIAEAAGENQDLDLAHLENITQDLRSTAASFDWVEADPTDGDLIIVNLPARPTTNVPTGVTLTDALFDGQGPDIMTAQQTMRQWIAVYFRLAAGTDVENFRLYFEGGSVTGGGAWTKVTGPDETTYDYWYITNSGLGTGPVARVHIQKHPGGAHKTTFGGGFAGTAKAITDATRSIAVGNQNAIAELAHLTRDLHAIDGQETWEDAADSDADLYAALSSVNPNTFTDSDFDNGGASVTIPSNADTGVYVRLPIAADHTLYRVQFGDDFGRSKAGNLWVSMDISAASTTYQYWWADGFTNFSGGVVKLQKRDATSAATRYDGEVANALSNADGAIGTDNLGDGIVTRPKLSATLQAEISEARSSAIVWQPLWTQEADSAEGRISGQTFEIDTVTLTGLEPGRPYEVIFNGTFTLTDEHAADSANNVDLVLVIGTTEYRLADRVNINGYSAQDHLFRSEGDTVVTIWPETETVEADLVLKSNRNNGITYIIKEGATLLLGQGVAAGSRQQAIFDFDDLPDTNSHDVGDIVASGDSFYKLGVTHDTLPNLFAGDVGRDVFNNTAGERWRGISNSQSPNGFSTDGEFTANPNNTLSLLLASSERHLRVAMKRSVYEAAKGSAFNASDHIAIKVTMADGTTTDEAVMAYYNAYTRNEDGVDTGYIIWQHRHATANYNLYSEAAGNAITVEFFTVTGDPPAATTTALLTHTADLKHWLRWPANDDSSADARTALNLAQANAARLDALDAQVDGTATPLHTQTYDENTALVAPLAGNAGDFAISETFSGVLTDDLLVVDWTKCEHLNHHDEHVVPGSDTDAGRLYFYPSNFDNTEWDGEFLYGVDRALQDNGAADELNSWIVASIVYQGSSLTFGLHLQQGGTRSNRNLKPRPGFSVTLRVFRNTNVTVATEGSLHSEVVTLKAQAAALEARATALEASSSPVKGIELGRLVGHDTNKLGEQPWTSLATGVTTTDGPGTGWSHWLSIPMHDYITLATGLGLILEMTRTGVTGQFSQIFIPWFAIGNWGGSGQGDPLFGGAWKESGTDNLDRIEVRGRINNGRLDLQAACGNADDEGTLHAYIAL